MKTFLRAISIKDRDSQTIYQMLQEIPKNDHGFENHAYGLSFTQFQSWIALNFDYSQGKNLPQGYVPQTYFWFYVNEQLSGMGKLRHSLTPKLKKAGGHIGYALRPSMRGQGLGTKLLGLLIKEARQLGIKDILVTCSLNNLPSRKVIEHNGGILHESTDTIHRFIIPHTV